MDLNFLCRIYFKRKFMKTKNIYFFFLFAFIGIMATVQAQTSQPVVIDQAIEFKPSGKVWGYVFGDYFTKLHADELNRGNTQYANMAKGSNAFAFRRVYLGYDYQISKTFSTQLILANENDNTDASGQRTVFIKAANLRWKNIVKNNDLIIGQSTTPLFSLNSESVWGYRSIEKTIADMRKLGSSSDLGVAWQGKLNDKGDYGYNLMIANGTSQKPENDKYKKFYGDVYAKFLNQQVILDFSGDYEASSSTQSKTTMKGFVAYQTKLFAVGVEVVNQFQKGASKDTTAGAANAKIADVVPFGLSVFVHGQIVPEKLNYFARFDTYNPNTKFNADVKYSTKMASDKENFITAGIDWTPIKNLHFMPNIWYNSYTSMKNNVTGTAKNDYDMTLRLTSYFIFK